MFQTGGEKDHWDWLSDLLAALSRVARVVGQKSQTAVFQKENGREGSVSTDHNYFSKNCPSERKEGI